jgi:hypothetical protein
MTPGQVTTPILWGACVIVALLLHCVWRSYPLASLVAAIVAMGVDQVALQAAYLLMQGETNAYGIARFFVFFPVALALAFAVGLPFLLLRQRRGRDVA